MPTFVKTGYWDKLSKAPKGFLNLEDLIASSIGSGLPGQVAFWGASGLGGSSNLVWDNVNNRLGIGVSSPLYRFHVVSAATLDSVFNCTLATGNNTIYLDNDLGRGLRIHSYGSTTTGTLIDGTINRASTSVIRTNSGTNTIVFGGLSNSAQNMYFGNTNFTLSLDNSTNSVSIGTKTFVGFKLDVVGGDARMNTVSIGLGGGSIATNTRVGASALNANTTGTSNVAFGNSAMLSNTTGINNVVVGTEAMYTSTTGSNNNVIVGRQAAYYCTAIVDSIAIGAAALSNALNSQRNIAIGRQSMINSVSGNDNTAIGYRALYGSASSTYANNTAIGSNALGNMLSGGNNTAVGYNAGLNAPIFGSNNTTSTNSIYLGYQTSASANGNTNEIVIGYDVAGIGSNTTTIGNSSTITTALRGRLLLGTLVDSGLYQLDVNGTARVSGASTFNNSLTNTIGGFVHSSVSSTNDAFYTLQSSNTRFYVNSGGYCKSTSSIVSDTNGSPSLNASAIAQIDSTTKGFLPPRMTTAQKNAIVSPAAGLVVYDTGLNKLCVFTTGWQTITSA